MSWAGICRRPGPFGEKLRKYTAFEWKFGGMRG